MTIEAIIWKPISEKPDSDLSILLFDQAAAEPVWLGYLDGETWRYVDGMPATPTHWSEMPGGPKA